MNYRAFLLLVGGLVMCSGCAKVDGELSGGDRDTQTTDQSISGSALSAPQQPLRVIEEPLSGLIQSETREMSSTGSDIVGGSGGGGDGEMYSGSVLSTMGE
ncbi:MAG TPA: hypothetical protein PLW93_00775 [Candidatus Absconditabacterales bacterium]|nr:hypothetical protein [Candidatus Absconditabacterales bacterium]HNG96784.1 hypothetical protein [Candidatus Absconditabacterales bacterium]